MVIVTRVGARLVDMVLSPHALVQSHSRLRLHSIYYITKQVCEALCLALATFQVCLSACGTSSEASRVAGAQLREIQCA